MTLERKFQNLFDYKYDVYKNVDLIKYQDKALPRKEILKIHRARSDKLYLERKKIWKELGL